MVSSDVSRFMVMSPSTGSRRSHLVNWATMSPAAMLAQKIVLLAVHDPW